MTKFKELKVDESLSETQFYKVSKLTLDKVQLITDDGQSIVVDKNYVDKHLISASQFDIEKPITKTEAANLFISNPNVVMTVNYNKQAKEVDVKEELYKLYGNKGKIQSEADYKKRVNNIVKSVMVGEERTITGRHFGLVTELGRVQFIDMEEKKDLAKDYDTRLRQVDPRTINYIILKSIKYKVK